MKSETADGERQDFKARGWVREPKFANSADLCKITLLLTVNEESKKFGVRGWLSGRASPSHGGGHWFESSTAHQKTAFGLFFFAQKKRLQPEKTTNTKGYKKHSASRKRSHQRKKVHKKGARVFLYDDHKAVFTPWLHHRAGEKSMEIVMNEKESLADGAFQPSFLVKDFCQTLSELTVARSCRWGVHVVGGAHD